MAVNLVTVTGSLETLSGATPMLGRMWFKLNRADWNLTGDIFAPEYIEAIANPATGAFTVAMQSTNDFQTGATYSAILRYREPLDGKDREYTVGTFALAPGGPFELGDLLTVPIIAPVPADILALCQAYAASASTNAASSLTNANAAAASAVQAALYSGVEVNTFAALIALTSANAPAVGQFVEVKELNAWAKRLASGGDLVHTTSTLFWQVLPGANGHSAKMFGAVGDGATNDSVAINAALVSISAIYTATGVAQTLVFPVGTYVARLIYLMPGVNINLNGAKILKTPAGAVVDELVLKWWRVIDTHATAFNTDAACAHRIVIEGGTIDGNRANMNWTNGTFNQEQAHCLFLSGGAAATNVNQRARFAVRNMHFAENVADGLSVYINADVIVENITADKCYRGGFVATGGNSKVTLRGYVGENARVDLEIDGAGFGGSFASDYDISDVIIDQKGGGFWTTSPRGGIDFGGSRGGQFRMRNVHAYSPPMNFSGQLSDPRKLIENCTFTLDGRDGTTNRFVVPTNGLFDACVFNVKYRAGQTNYAAVEIFPTGIVNAAKMEFERCVFNLDPSVKAALPGAASVCQAVYLQASHSDGSSNNGSVSSSFKDCQYTGAWDEAVAVQQGGTVTVNGGYFESLKAFRAVSTAGRPAQLTVIGALTFGTAVTGLFVDVAQATQTNAFIKFQDATLNRYVAAGAAMVEYPITGHYKFPTTAAPGGSFGAIRGAIAELATALVSNANWAVTEWKSTQSHASSGIWVQSGHQVVKGVTASRPALTSADIGVQYLDTTLAAGGKPIWFDGSVWRDGLGASV